MFDGNSGALTPDSSDNAWASSLSADGRYVAFQSQLAGSDVSDIFVKDLQTGVVQQVSLSAEGGGEPDGNSMRPDISPDGRYVIFTSTADDLVPGGTDGSPHTFIYDTLTQTTTLVSQSAINGLADGDSSWGEAVSGGGIYAVFGSTADNLTGDGANGVANVYLVDNSGGTSGAVVEEEQATTLTTTGTIPFSDAGPSDGHSVSWSLLSVTNTNGNVSEDEITALLHDFVACVDESTGTGQVQWTFTGDEADFARLQFGENLQATYRLVLDGNDGGPTATQDVNITIIGTPAAPQITSGVTTGAVEDGGQTTATGQLTATDADNSDTQTWTIDGGQIPPGSVDSIFRDSTERSI